jgi:pimeloyl-ACP methyl ester carboxylesterase
VIAAVEEVLPSDGPGRTAEVDVIGMSMGGLVARVAAEFDVPGEPQLNIARLFTISSPLRGSRLANSWIALTPLHRDMRAGSDLLEEINLVPPPYPIFPYTRLGDWIVGEEFAAPAGEVAWWLDTPPLQMPHFGAMVDRRILADIVRRLRGETPFALEPRAPLPGRG